MNRDLKIIKKRYGEKFMHLCRELFSTIIDTSPGLLPKILFETFHPTHYLYNDLITYNAINQFKEYIYSFYEKLTNDAENQMKAKCHVEDPMTLMKKAGYTLYACHTEQDIQEFRKYYTFEETLCTFRGGRLKKCFVYFAVKDGVEELNRQNYVHPDRQDEYGTSVISIQFTKDDSHTLSIKNRYNHTVTNPDATFSNDLDNIIPGLTQSFADYYGMVQTQIFSKKFELPGYVRANNGKIYKYNYEINNVYYCPDNVIINQYRPIELSKEKYLIFDYFVLDLVNKKFLTYPYYESFPDTIGQIKNITITNNHDKKNLTITPQTGEDIIIELDKYHRIISLKNNNVTKIGSEFLLNNHVLENIQLGNVTEIGNKFLYNNLNLREIYIPKVKTIGNNFLQNNNTITTIDFPELISLGDHFMSQSNVANIHLPNLMTIGSYFMIHNESLCEFELPNVSRINAYFLSTNKILNKISLPNVRIIGPHFLEDNKVLTKISFPQVGEINSHFCFSNEIIDEVSLPKVRSIGNCFMVYNKKLPIIELPNVLIIGNQFMYFNKILKKAIMPNLRSIGDSPLTHNENLSEFYVPSLTSHLENSKLRKLAKKSKPKLLTRILNNGK